MRHTTSKKLFTYWNNLKGNRPAPERTEIEPSDIRDILGDTFILEVDHMYRTINFRLAGTKLCSTYGRELKSVGYLGLWDEADNLKIFDAVKQVYHNSQPIVIAHLAETQNKQFLAYETILVPLLNGSSQTVRILGSASPSEVPSWIGNDPVINNRIKSVRKVDMPIATPEAFPGNRQNKVFGHVNSPLLSPELPIQGNNSQDKPRRIGHLTVIDGGLETE